MAILEINVQGRAGRGKGDARKLRAKLMTPGIFYGPSVEPVPVSFSQLELKKTLRGHNWGATLLRFKSPEKAIDGKTVRLKSWDTHPYRPGLIHADFQEVDLTKKITVSVPLRFVGKAKGVEEGGLLQPIHREISIKVAPTEIPEFIEVDVAPVSLNHPMKYSDVKLASGVELVSPAEEAIVTIVIIEEEVLTPAPVAAAEGAVAADGTAAAPADGAAAAPADAAGKKADAKGGDAKKGDKAPAGDKK